MAKTITQITYFVHGTTTDNEHNLASGWADAELSEKGIQQSIDLQKQIDIGAFDAVFCSDLKRAIDSAKLTFGDSAKIIQDKRLREIDYGKMTLAPSEKVNAEILQHIDKTFPNGESYKRVEKRVHAFLIDLSVMLPEKRVAIVAHRATQLALEVILNKKTWQQAVEEDWRLQSPKAWKPGWQYLLKEKRL